MTLKGTIKTILPAESGESSKGGWQKRTFIIELPDDKYPKSVALQVWGELVDSIPPTGTTVTAHIDIQSREYNGRWYTDVKAWKIESDGASRSEPEVDEDDGQGLPF